MYFNIVGTKHQLRGFTSTSVDVEVCKYFAKWYDKEKFPEKTPVLFKIFCNNESGKNFFPLGTSTIYPKEAEIVFADGLYYYIADVYYADENFERSETSKDHAVIEFKNSEDMMEELKKSELAI